MKFDPASESEHTPKLLSGGFRDGEPTNCVEGERGKRPRRNKGLLGIAFFKWFKGAVLLLLSFGLFKMLHRDVGQFAEDFANKLRVDPDNRYLGALLAKLNLLDDKKLAALTGLTFAYSALFFTEGTGLFFEKRWAEYLTIVATASFLPLEIHELFKDPSVVKWSLLALNLAIIGFLIVTLRRSKPSCVPLQEGSRRSIGQIGSEE